jgi:hypothetical protein
MKNNGYGATSYKARTLVLAALATVIMASGSTATATHDGRIRISGNSTFSDCGATGSDFALRMTGDLKGCLSIFVQGYTCKEVNGFAHYTERGREAFVGMWRGQHGRFATTYTVDAAYAQGFCDSFDFSLELSGSCIHKITGKSGVFMGTEGLYTMFDVITNVTGNPVTGTFAAGSGGNNFLYFGHIQYISSPTADAMDSGPSLFESVDNEDVAAYGFADRGTLQGRIGRDRRC